MRRLPDELPRRVGQPAHHPVVDGARRVLHLDRGQQLAGHPLDRSAVLGEHPGGVAVPGRADRGGHSVVQRRPDQWVPEREFGAVVEQDAGQDRLVQDRQQVGDPLAGQQCQLSDGEVLAEQRGRA